MPDFVIPPSPAPSLPVRGTQARFPLRRVYCIGRNYAAHAVEMGHDPDREPPFFFQKNPDNLRAGSDSFPHPGGEVHHEVELAIALAGGGRDIAPDAAEALIWGYAVALDMTRRDLQAEAKRMGRPWELAKAFEHSAPIGPLVPASEIGHPQAGAITLHVNAAPRQAGDLAQMIWKPSEMIAELSRFVSLAAGDVILTGTPAGVGPVAPGDVLDARIDGVGALRVTVV